MVYVDNDEKYDSYGNYAIKSRFTLLTADFFFTHLINCRLDYIDTRKMYSNGYGIHISKINVSGSGDLPFFCDNVGVTRFDSAQTSSY